MCYLTLLSATLGLCCMRGATLHLGVVGLLAIGMFSSCNLARVYVLFEGSMVPVVLLVLTHGGNPERLSATFYLIAYRLLRWVPLVGVMSNSSLLCECGGSYIGFCHPCWSSS